MTVNISLDTTFRGIPLRNFRPLMAEWLLGTRNFSYLAQSKKIDLDEYTIVGLIEESYRAGFMEFGPEEYVRPGMENRFLKLTGQGIGIASASATKRTSKKAASEHLQNLLERCGDNNRNDLSPIEIGEVWIYGSMLDEAKEDVGDIDIVVLARRKSAFRGRSIVKHIDQHFPGLLPKTRDPLFFDADSAFIQKAVYGPRRHAIFSPNSLQTLINLHRPCAKVFDSAAGGRVEIVTLPHHPFSTERAATIQPRAALPEFPVSLQEFTPTPVQLAAGRYTNTMWSARDFDILTADEARQRLDGRVLKGVELSSDAVVFIPGQQNIASSAVIFERKYSTDNADPEYEQWTIDAQLSLRGNRAGFGPKWIEPVKQTISTTLGADISRLLGHRHEMKSTADIHATLSLVKTSSEGRDLVRGIGKYIGSRVFSPYDSHSTRHLKYGVCFSANSDVYEFESIFSMDDFELEELGPKLNVDLDKMKSSSRYQTLWQSAFTGG